MKSFLIVILSTLLVLCASVNSTETIKFKASDHVSVSGVSSGGFFAAQMLVAFSNDIKGAGLFASGPYFCTRGTIMTTVDCMTTGISIYTDQLILAAKAYETLGLIDNMNNLAEARVFVYSGESDYIVWPGVVKKNEEFFRKLGSHMKSDYSINSVHCMPTDFYGNKCDHLGDPYINNCNYNGAKIALDHIH